MSKNMKDIKDFGAKGDGRTDDTQAFIDAIASGEPIYISPGRYRCFPITTDNKIQFFGAGWADSVMVAGHPAAPMIQTSSHKASFIEKIGFDIDFIADPTPAFRFYTTDENINFGTRIRDCNFNKVQLNFEDAAGWVVDSCYFTSYVGQAVNVMDVAQPDAGDSAIINCIFDAGDQKSVAVLQQSSGGLRIESSKFLNGSYHYLGQFNAKSSTSILVFSGNSSEWASDCNFAITSQNKTGFGLVVIGDNEFSIPANGTGILLQDPGYEYLNSVMIGNNVLNCGQNCTGMALARGNAITVNTNVLSGPANVGLSFGANIGSAYVVPQNMNGVKTDYAGVNAKVKLNKYA